MSSDFFVARAAWALAFEKSNAAMRLYLQSTREGMPDAAALQRVLGLQYKADVLTKAMLAESATLAAEAKQGWTKAAPDRDCRT